MSYSMCNMSSLRQEQIHGNPCFSYHTSYLIGPLLLNKCTRYSFFYHHQEYMIEREGEYPTPVYLSVVSLDRGHDLYNVIHTCGISLFVQSNYDMASQRACSKTTTTWPAVICMNNIIKVMSPIKAYYTGVYWSRILSLPLYYILLPSWKQKPCK